MRQAVRRGRCHMAVNAYTHTDHLLATCAPSRRYGGHISSYHKMKIGNDLPPLGLAVAMLDLPGHGYSEGERAWIKQYSHWVDDILQVLLPLTIPCVVGVYGFA